jgi:hypothetical protein
MSQQDRRVLCRSIGGWRAAAALAAAGLAVLAPLVHAGAAGGTSTAPGVPLTAAPATSDPTVSSSHAYFTHTAHPGEVWHDAIVAANTGGTTVAANVYPTDGLTAAATGSVYAPGTRAAAKTGRWVNPAVSSVTVPAHGSVRVGFTVVVPPDAAPGDHLGGIALEAQSAAAGQGTFAVSTLWRTIVGVLLQVPGAAPAHIAVSSATLTPLSTGSTAAVAIAMENTGQLLTRPALKVTLTNRSGYRRAVGLQLGTMLPTDPVPYVLPWPDGLQAGAYDVRVELVPPNGPSTIFETSAQLQAALPGSVSNGATPPLATTAMAPVPLWLLVGCPPVAVAAAFALVLFLRRRRHGACQHCGKVPSSGSLMTCLEIEEMAACRSCALRVHNHGRVLLCVACYVKHAGVTARPLATV